MNINNRFVRMREFLGLNQTQLAKIVGVEPSAINKYEKTGKITRQTIMILEMKYSLNPEWMMTGNGEMFTNKQLVLNDTGAEATYNVKKPPERPPCDETEKTLLSKDEQVSMLIMQNDKLINIVEKHTATIYNLTTPIQLEVPKAETKSGGSVPKNVQG